MAISWNENNAAHLLRRAGFAATKSDVKKALKLGLQETVNSLLKPDKSSSSLPPHTDSLERLQGWWLRRIATSKSPATEKLTLFWHNHFATSIQKVDSVDYMHHQNKVLRSGALGKFRDLVTAIAKSPAMLIWLDSDTNLASNPNQNFARELMEVFTTGVLDKNGQPNYNELDVEAAARAFTGWQYDGFDFFLNESEHDFGQKTFKGHTGQFDGIDIINFLVVEDATARRVALKLFNYYAFNVSLSNPVLDPLVSAYLQNDTAIAPVLQTLFTSDVFYSDAAKYAHIRGPAELLGATMRLTSAKVTGKGEGVSDLVRGMGQSLFAPPSVFGWKEGLAWLSTAGVLSRTETASAFATARDSRAAVKLSIQKLLGSGSKNFTAEEAVDRLSFVLDMQNLRPTTRSAVITYLQQDSLGSPTEFTVNKDTIDTKIRGALSLLLSSPEFQVC